MAKEIPLTRGHVAIVDDEDFERCATRRWATHTNSKCVPRAVSHWCEGGKYKSIGLGRFILDAPVGRYVDHINGDPLDNRRANLRLCTPTENARNRRRGRHNTSGFKGVQVRPYGFTAAIRLDGNLHKLGRFETAEAAASAYDRAARAMFGEFACLNFPEPHERAA